LLTTNSQLNDCGERNGDAIQQYRKKYEFQEYRQTFFF
jgi:hypothetical protein